MVNPIEAKLRLMLENYKSSDFCGCYDGDMTDELPGAKERLIHDILKVLVESSNG